MSARFICTVIHSETKAKYFVFETEEGIKFTSKDKDDKDSSIDVLNINLQDYLEGEEILKGRYRHFKGNEYEVLGVVYDLDGEKYVFYKALYWRDDIRFFIRPYDMFFSFTDKKKYPGATQRFRFERI